jgi:hypothetical protein
MAVDPSMTIELTSAGTLATMVLATGALGTASFGVVDGLKWTRLGESGFPTIKKLLGPALMRALHYAYGERYEEFLRAQYRDGRGKGEIGRTLRQGIRIGMYDMSDADVDKLVAQLPGVNPDALKAATSSQKSGEPPTDEQRQALARFEMAVDARIDAALALAEDRYVGAARGAASMFSVVFALIVGFILGLSGGGMGGLWQTVGFSVLIGIAAVPVAPVAKDIATALSSAEQALRRRQ